VGSRICFWDDIWCGDRALKEAFPGLFTIARFKEASITDNAEHSNGTIQWNIQFSRLFHDWEVEELALFYKCLYTCKLRGVGKDKLWRLPSSKGMFEVKSFYRALSPRGPPSSLGRVFGDPRLLLEWRFLFGEQFGIRSLLWTILGGEVWWW
jgi:hypothetical protein